MELPRVTYGYQKLWRPQTNQTRKYSIYQLGEGDRFVGICQPLQLSTTQRIGLYVLVLLALQSLQNKQTETLNVKCEKKRQRQTKHDPSPGITEKSPSNQSISLSNHISKSLSLLPIIIILCHLHISLLVRRYCHTNGQLIRIISLVSLHVLSVLTLQCVDKLRSGTGEEGQVDMAR